MGVFKAYDIRGIVPQEINVEFARALGIAFGSMRVEEISSEDSREAGPKYITPSIVVGRDMRVSSKEFADAIINGLISVGCDVIDIGLVSTPAFYFAVANYGYDGGVMVSASHNGKEYNGFKLTRDAAKPVGKGTGMETLEKIFHNVLSKAPFESKIKTEETRETKGVFEELHNITAEYVDYNFKESGFDSAKFKFKIAADPANAMGAQYIQEIFSRLPYVKFLKMNFELDGSFPSHEPDPLRPQNCAPLQEFVIKEGADFGIATDGDGDRIFFVDDSGAVVQPSILRGLIAQEILKKNPGANICYDTRPGRVTRDMIEEAGGVPIVTPVGHSIIKDWAIKNQCAFAGESSGHFFVSRSHGLYEDPVYVILTLIKRIAEEGKKLSEIINRYRKYFHSGEINFTVENPLVVIKEIEDKYATGADFVAGGERASAVFPKIGRLDGITVEFENVWFNVRASNTEPLLRLTVEARDKETLDKYVEEIGNFIRANKK